MGGKAFSLAVGALRERDADGRPLALGPPTLTSPRSNSARSTGTRGRQRSSAGVSPRTSPRFEVAEGEDVTDAAQVSQFTCFTGAKVQTLTQLERSG